MSKEQLEGIDKVVDDLLNNRAELSNFVNDYYLQADRVYELEKEIKGRKKFELGTASNLKILREQNKRYREALQRIVDVRGYESIGFLRSIAREALEGES